MTTILMSNIHILETGVYKPTDQHPTVFSALTVFFRLSVRKSIQPVKIIEWWDAVWSEMQMICIWSNITPSSLASWKVYTGLPFWCWTQIGNRMWLIKRHHCQWPWMTLKVTFA